MNKNTKIIIGVIVVLIVIGGIWYGVSKQSKEQGTIKIGVIGHFSGELASYGIPTKNAVQLATEEINGKGGINGKKVELIIEDDNSNSNQAVSAMNKLVNIDNVNYIISVQGSGMTSAIIPIAQNNKRILMITLASAPELIKDKDYIFRSVPSDSYQAVKMVDFINNNLQSKKVAGLYVNDAYGVGIKNIINENKRVEIVASEMFEFGATDFKTQLLKIKQAGVDTLVIVARENEYPLILKQIKELKIVAKIVASETFKDEKVLVNSGSNAEGVFVTFMAEPTDYVNFTNNYKDRFNEEPSAYSMYGYDGIIALFKAIKNAGDNPNAVKDELIKISFDGASGKVGFDKDRERVGAKYIIYSVKNGQFVPYAE